jgi:hypothetical protein
MDQRLSSIFICSLIAAKYFRLEPLLHAASDTSDWKTPPVLQA